MKEISTILDDALGIHDASAREEYLRQSCGEDVELRNRVERLLKSHAAAGDFLQVPAMATFVVPGMAESPGAYIGPYLLCEKIGEGGMGIVYLAEQSVPIQRRVALKLVKLGMDTRQVLARFEAERQTLALLSHPNIARILDAGASESGRPYFVMELVHGIPVTAYCNQKKLTIHQRIELFIPVCLAVQHAHQRGIIHRDLKPSNILVEVQDETPVPKVIDFGIAKATGQRLSDHTLDTQFVQLIGTPVYMSPERVQRAAIDIDTRSDVYSLGVLLYEILTGTTPFDQATLMEKGPDEMRRMIREVEPQRPSQRIRALPAAQSLEVADQRQTSPRALCRDLEHELDWIVNQSLEKDRERRYESASALAADLQRYLDNQTVSACPPTLIYQLQKSIRRHKIAILMTTMVTMSLLVGAAIAAWLAVVANQERLRAEAAEQAHRQQTELAENLLYASSIRLANRHKQSSDDEQASQLLNSWAPSPGETDRRGIEWHLLYRQLSIPGDVLLTLPGDVSCTRVSPDGSCVVAATNRGLVQRYNTTTKQQLAGWESGLADVRRMEFSPDGRYLALISYEAEAAVIETATGSVRLRCPSPEKPTAHADVSFVDGKLLTSGNGGLISIWNIKQAKLERLWDTGTPNVYEMTTRPDYHGVFLLVDEDNSDTIARVLRIPRLDDGQPDRQMKLGFDPSTMAVSPDGRMFAVGNPAGEVILWDQTRELEIAKWHLSEKINELSFSPDGAFLAAAERTGVVHVWDWQQPSSSPRNSMREQHFHWQAHPRPARTAIFTPDSRGVISSGIDGRVVHWHNWNHAHASKTVASPPVFKSLKVLPGAHAIAVTDSHDLQIFDLRTGMSSGKQRLTDQVNELNSIAVDDSGRWLASASECNEILCGPLQLAPKLTPLPESRPRGPYRNLITFLPDTRTLISIESDSRLRVSGWDVEQRKLVFDHHREDINAFHFAMSQTSPEILLVTSQEVVRVNVMTSETTGRWPFDGSVATAAAISREGTLLAIGRNDRTILLLDAWTGEVRRTIRGHLSTPEQLVFSADGRTLIALDNRGELRFWQVASGSELLTWPSPSRINEFDLSQDNRGFAVVHDGTIELFEINPIEN